MVRLGRNALISERILVSHGYHIFDMSRKFGDLHLNHAVGAMYVLVHSTRRKNNRHKTWDQRRFFYDKWIGRACKSWKKCFFIYLFNRLSEWKNNYRGPFLMDRFIGSIFSEIFELRSCYVCLFFKKKKGNPLGKIAGIKML